MPSHAQTLVLGTSLVSLLALLTGCRAAAPASTNESMLSRKVSLKTDTTENARPPTSPQMLSTRGAARPRPSSQKVSTREDARPRSRPKKVEIASPELELWLGRHALQLVKFKPDANTRRLKREENSRESVISFHVLHPRGPEGLIDLRGDEWVYIKAYSTHGWGSLVLALDSEGHLHACNTHVCPYLFLVFDGPAPDELTLDGFLASRVDPEGKGADRWQLVDEWKAGSREAVHFESSDKLVAAAKALKKGDSTDRVLERLGLYDGIGSGAEGWSFLWTLEGDRLYVHFTAENLVSKVYFEPNAGKRFRII